MSWSVRLAAGAEVDIAEIATWTLHRFGPKQAEIYVATLLGGLRSLGDGPNALGTSGLGQVAPNLRLFRVPRTRHFVMFRADFAAQQIQILRILHASMEPTLHLPPET
jgi:plasmid stabilization system protein ParE